MPLKLSNLFETYENLVRENAGAVSLAEGALQSLVWLLPDRFSDSELKCEALNALLGLISLYHNTILEKTASSDGSTSEFCPTPLLFVHLLQFVSYSS